MSSTPVTLRVGLNDQLRCVEINETIINKKKTEDSDSISEVEYKHENLVASLDMHVLTSLLYMLQRMNEKQPSTCCLAAKHPEQVEHCQHPRKTSDLFSFHQPRSYISTQKFFA